MRIAAIYDIHGNLPALQAVLADVEAANVDLILAGGDVASGPMPTETLDLLMALGTRARFIRGNADREVVSRYDQGAGTTAATADDPAGRALAWTAERISRAQRDFLAEFSEQLTLQITGLGSAFFCHGSPRGDEEMITPATPSCRVQDMLVGVDQDCVVCGHTHMQFDRVIAGKRVINAGSVGMPYEGKSGAYWVLLGPDVSFRLTLYDFEEAARMIRAGGYPDAEEFARANVLNPPTAAEATAVFEKLAQERFAARGGAGD
ncbi:MAG: metallophosphoesterase family protein [Chloroflexota bacterium]